MNTTNETEWTTVTKKIKINRKKQNEIILNGIKLLHNLQIYNITELRIGQPYLIIGGARYKRCKGIIENINLDRNMIKMKVYEYVARSYGDKVKYTYFNHYGINCINIEKYDDIDAIYKLPSFEFTRDRLLKQLLPETANEVLTRHTKEFL